MHMSLVLLKLPEVRRRTALQVTAVYAKVKAGLFTPPVKLTARSSAWPEHEVDAINAATIAGASDDAMRGLVRKLVAARTSMMPKTDAA
jgi:prophage regulatory protein